MIARSVNVLDKQMCAECRCCHEVNRFLESVSGRVLCARRDCDNIVRSYGARVYNAPDKPEGRP